MNQEVALLLKFLLLSFRFQTLVFDFCQKIFTVYPILDLGLAAFPFILSNIGKANPPLHHFIFCNENIYWYEAQVLSLEPWAPRIGRRPNCERRSPLQNPYPKSILFILFSRWHLLAHEHHEHAVDFSEVPVRLRRLWLHLPNPRAEGCPLVYSIWCGLLPMPFCL